MPVSYYVLEVGIPGKPKCPDEPEEVGPATLICPRSKLLIVQIAKNAAYVQLGVMPEKGSFEGSVIWQKPRMWMPVSFALPRVFDAVRVYNFKAKEEAQVTLEAV
jgi:hypothetical protein